MRLISDQQEEVFNKLLALAGGQTLLVERALRESSGAVGGAPLGKVIAYIKEHRDQRRSGKGER